MKLTLSMFKRIFQIKAFKTPSLPIQGYTSRTFDGKHVLFLDYDLVNPDIVKMDIFNLVEKFNISHAYVFSTFEEKDELGTYGNYHVICLDKFYFNDIFKMMEITHCDTYHKKLARNTRYRSWVLRFTGKGKRPKPMLVDFHFNHLARGQREQSNAHYLLMKKLNPHLPELPFNSFDYSTKVTITKYNTGKEMKVE